MQLIGRLGVDPAAKTVGNSVKTSFTLATNTVYKDGEGNKKTLTDWHQVIAWGRLAQTMDEHLKKGDRIGISGRLTTRSYEDANGAKKYITEIIAKDLLMLGAPSKEH